MVSEHIKVSVCMAVYGNSKFLEEQLASIINQTYSIFEIIIVEDMHPKDTSEETISRFNIQCIRSNKLTVEYIKLDNNVGPAEAFRLAICKSSGDIVALCDQDDIWFSNKISAIVSVFTSSTKAVYHNGIVLGDDYHFKNGDRLYTDKEVISSVKLFLKNHIIGATLAVDGRVAREYSAKYSFSPMHDWVLVILLLLNRHKIQYIDIPLMFYRRHCMTVTGKSQTFISKIRRALNFRFKLLTSIFNYKRTL